MVRVNVRGPDAARRRRDMYVSPSPVASRDREGPRGNASGMGGSKGKGAGGAQ